MARSQYSDSYTDGIEKQVTANQVAAEAGKDSADLAQKTFLFANRQKFIVRHIGIPGDCIRFEVVNTGGTAGIGREISLCLLDSFPPGSLPGQPPYAESKQISMRLDSGQSEEMTHSLSKEEIEDIEMQIGFGNFQTDKVLLGYIQYADDLGRKYRTAIARQLNAKGASFSPSDNPEYEYQD
ncbi:MAG: hypothetical protein U0172_10190 [Nitrospiraceae bacterium]